MKLVLERSKALKMICDCRIIVSYSEAHGGPLQHLLRLHSHEAQPAHPLGCYQSGAGCAHPLRVLAALLLRAQIW